jgi:hypothetical protein
MSLTKASYSMITGAPINVLDYAGLAKTVTAKSPSDSHSHLFTSFLSWRIPIQTALNQANANGGGCVVLPKNTVPYYVDDYLTIYSNTTLICEDWIVLADYTTTGGTFSAIGENILVINFKLDNSNLYAGSSGQNGIGAGGTLNTVNSKNIKFYGGVIKNCSSGNGNDGTGDGGKGVQIEPGNLEDFVIDGMTFSNCFMAMSNIRDYTTGPDNLPYMGILYNNITVDNCYIIFFAKQADGAEVQTGLQQTIHLNNFYAIASGTFEGCFQFSRATNIKISNGTVVVPSAYTATSLIRGNHADCTFENIEWYGNTHSCINLDPSTYAVDSSQANQNNVYKINVLGTIDVIADATVTTPYRTLNNCYGEFIFTNTLNTGFFGYELRNGTSTFFVGYGTTQGVVTTSTAFIGSALTTNFSGMSAGIYNVPVFENNFYQSFTPIAATSAPNQSLFLNTATNKLSYKDNTGTVNALY